jgi:hypothetical protein
VENQYKRPAKVPQHDETKSTLTSATFLGIQRFNELNFDGVMFAQIVIA